MSSELRSTLPRVTLLLGEAWCLYGCGSSTPVSGGAMIVPMIFRPFRWCH